MIITIMKKSHIKKQLNALEKQFPFVARPFIETLAKRSRDLEKLNGDKSLLEETILFVIEIPYIEPTDALSDSLENDNFQKKRYEDYVKISNWHTNFQPDQLVQFFKKSGLSISVRVNTATIKQSYIFTHGIESLADDEIIEENEMKEQMGNKYFLCEIILSDEKISEIAYEISKTNNYNKGITHEEHSTHEKNCKRKKQLMYFPQSNTVVFDGKRYTFRPGSKTHALVDFLYKNKNVPFNISDIVNNCNKKVKNTAHLFKKEKDIDDTIRNLRKSLKCCKNAYFPIIKATVRGKITWTLID